jgi:hypothetical protein
MWRKEMDWGYLCEIQKERKHLKDQEYVGE